ncbi:MAG: BadF/BadG/BcrA/BcrD ATPase family protein [Opitutus sp.]
MGAPYRIGIDGGGTKTECILIDAAGAILARHLAPGCNPNGVGPGQARMVVTDALCGVVNSAFGNGGATIERTHIYAAGNRSFWREIGGSLEGFGVVHTADDSLPVLELATQGRPGLVLHGGTGSFVAVRAPDGSIHYGGGLGWRFGDPGGGYDLGRRTIARALIELQGWLPASRLAQTVRDHTQLGDGADAAAITRFLYQHPDPNRQVAALAPAVLRLASEGDPVAHQLVVESAAELLALATRMAAQLFPATALDTIPAGLSGPLLTHPVVVAALGDRSPLALVPVEGTPIEGVRRLLLRG